MLTLGLAMTLVACSSITHSSTAHASIAQRASAQGSIAGAAIEDETWTPASTLERLSSIEFKTHAEQEYQAASATLAGVMEELDRQLSLTGSNALKGNTLIDARLLRASARRQQFEIDELELYKVVPVRYLSLSTTNSLFTRPCAQPDSVIERSIEELSRLDELLANARTNLTQPARVWTENAISTSRYASHMLTEEIQEVCVDSEDLRQRLLGAAAAAAELIAEFRAWLTTDLLPRSTRNPSWTPEQVEVYQFEHEFLSDFSVDTMLEIAREEEQATTEAMRDLARRIHPSGDVKTVWELMKDETPPWTEVETMAARYVDLAAAWLKTKGSHLVSIPERFDYGVQITAPMSRRVLSFGGASYGPTIGGRISGYYVLTPLEPWLSETEAASRLRSYNPYWTHVISYHEWLGHNVQRAIAHAHADTPTRRQFSSIYLSQAWSFYLEKLLEDEGYFEDALPHTEALKTRMARLQMRMWRVQRILTKLEMAKGITSFEEAVDAYVEKIGMEPTNAFIEVQRDSQSPSPPGREIIGERYIFELRSEYFRRLGEHATLAGFHEALLRYGNLPLPIVRQLMFNDI